jgi:hypothetical protein
MIHTDGKPTIASAPRSEPAPQPSSTLRYELTTLRPMGDGYSVPQRAYFNDLPDALRARDHCREHGCQSMVLDRTTNLPLTWPDVCRCSWTESRCPFRAGDVAGCSAAQGLD